MSCTELGTIERRRSLVGCSPWGREESDMTERLPFHFSLSCIGEGNGNADQQIPSLHSSHLLYLTHTSQHIICLKLAQGQVLGL